MSSNVTFKCPYCKNSYVVETLEEDAMGFEYVEKTLECKYGENCNFEALTEENIDAVCEK